ncbi:2-oxoadipate dioxygenase/decarboxylase family protein [Pseudoduganella namucuonensis]|uniref:2-oxoadipate dioxygenase/decarboxylase n=1 Tax=Pseudoduganella namucuonensis TaxID=1035707 RepID=A0A1I7KTJ5_9BURK|nr:DUF1338 family protein [Pseudoduganella namucuonensis]SFV00783.1 protein of unknown function [Pseudoduganella namucuonensis]
MTTLDYLLTSCIGAAATARMTRLMHVPAEFRCSPGNGDATLSVTRAEIAYAMNVLLFRELLERVPEGMAYTEDAVASGRRVFFDHGAVRTVKIARNGQLPCGEAAIVRFLKPLGYHLNESYPLPRLKMMGRAYMHADLPEDIPQFFVSELEVERFSPGFQAAVGRVVASSADPLDASDIALLDELAARRGLPLNQAVALLRSLLRCFGRQHAVPALADYELLLEESQEMAWIATEGNAFNHVTDRVPDLHALAAEQQRLGRSIKPHIEEATRGTMRQTAYRAAQVERVFRTPEGCVVRRVPGSFYEFISRDRVRNDEGEMALDLGFDSGNATAIFKMTSIDGLKAAA